MTSTISTPTKVCHQYHADGQASHTAWWSSKVCEVAERQWEAQGSVGPFILSQPYANARARWRITQNAKKYRANTK